MTLLIIATSKVPFYLAGGLFAVWAVVLSALGLRNPRFPGNMRGQQLVILISAILLVVSVGTAIATA